MPSAIRSCGREQLHDHRPFVVARRVPAAEPQNGLIAVRCGGLAGGAIAGAQGVEAAEGHRRPRPEDARDRPELPRGQPAQQRVADREVERRVRGVARVEQQHPAESTTRAPPPRAAAGARSAAARGPPRWAAPASWPPAQPSQRTVRRGLTMPTEPEHAAERDERGRDPDAHVERAAPTRPRPRRAPARASAGGSAATSACASVALLGLVDRALRAAGVSGARSSASSIDAENVRGDHGAERGDDEQARRRARSRC